MAAQHQRKRVRYSRKQPYGSKDSKECVDVPLTPYTDQFQVYQEELDCKHDKYERLVKLSRDCTILSKRTIFLLHRIGGETEKKKVLNEAEAKIEEVQKCFQTIALELVGQDPDKFHRAYSPGVQEFIEALSYFVFLKNGTLLSIEEAQAHLTFRQRVTEVAGVRVIGEKGEASTEELMEVEEVMYRVPLDPIDFVLGVADLTGELMRMSINAIGSGDHNLPFELLAFVRAIYCAFSSLWPVSRDIPQKLNILRNSLGKIEQVCYTLKIRGSEMPKDILADVFTARSSAPDASADNYD